MEERDTTTIYHWWQGRHHWGGRPPAVTHFPVQQPHLNDPRRHRGIHLQVFLSSCELLAQELQAKDPLLRLIRRSCIKCTTCTLAPNTVADIIPNTEPPRHRWETAGDSRPPESLMCLNQTRVESGSVEITASRQPACLVAAWWVLGMTEVTVFLAYVFPWIHVIAHASDFLPKVKLAS